MEKADTKADTDWGRVVYADDLRVGDRYELGHHTVTEEELVNFASAWDPQPFHIDQDVAEQGYFGGLIASGLHTLSVYQRLVVTSANREWKVIAGRSLRDVRFVRPVRANDVLTGTMVIDEIRLDDRARGLVTTSAELVNAQGNCVLTVTTDAYLHSRAG
jgi:acyl dehydratase